MAATSRIPTQDGFVIGQDLNYESIREDWNVYKLEDGTILKAKLVAVKISRGLGEDGKSILYTDTGEPLYNIRHTVIISAEVPKELVK